MSGDDGGFDRTLGVDVRGGTTNGVLAFAGLSALNLFLGANPGFQEDLVGRMDDAFVYVRVLGADEVADIYRNGFDDPAPVPLPATFAGLLAAIGFLGAAGARRKA